MSMKSRIAVWIAVAGMASGSAVLAQEAIPTAGGSATTAAPTPASTGTLRLPDQREDNGDDIVRSVGPCGAPPKADGKPDNAPHGEVFAGVGTHGYREGGGIVCVPLGDKTAVTLAVDAGRIDGRGGRH
jgi:hypothetical protein